MTRYEQMLTFDIDTMAAFLYGIIDGTEERLLANLSALGIEASLCSMSEELRIAQIKDDLLKEADNEST